MLRLRSAPPAVRGAELGAIGNLHIHVKMKLKISAPTIVVDEARQPVREAARLATLDGITHDECFSDYLLDNPHTKTLPARGVSGGYLRFRFRSEKQELWAVTEYDLRVPLSDEETKAVVTYTIGQWSDGIGENFSQNYADEHGLFITVKSQHVQTEIA